jgi:hypothetical protein
MKKIAVLLLLSVSLYAADYKSNAIAQHLEPIDRLSLSGYEVRETEGRETLYLDGKPISEKYAEGNVIRLERDGRIEITEYEAGLPKTLTVIEGERREETVYEYEGALLCRKRLTVNGRLEKIITYFYADGVLSGYTESGRTGDSVFLFASEAVGYAYADGKTADSVRFFPAGVMKHDSYPLTDVVSTDSSFQDGQLSLSDTMADGSVKSSVYGEDGRLLEERVEAEGIVVSSVLYSYDEEGRLETVKERNGESLVIRKYKDGKKDSSESYRSGVLLSIRTFDDEEGDVEIKYKKGKPYARLTYDEDGKTLLSLDML